MDQKVAAVIADIEQRLGADLSGVVPHFYSDGATDATVFNLADKYLVKITDLNTIRTQAEFLQENPNDVFQSLLCSNEKLGYECFEFIDGIHYDEGLIDAKVATEQIAEIVRNYRKYPHDGYGFLNEEHVSWRAFLLDEIEYARRTIPNVSTEKVMSALVVGDYLYDFYFALLSNVEIFTRLGADYIYSFFPERDGSYKRAILTVALYVRMSRAATYDKKNLPAYFDLYGAIIEK